MMPDGSPNARPASNSTVLSFAVVDVGDWGEAMRMSPYASGVEVVVVSGVAVAGAALSGVGGCRADMVSLVCDAPEPVHAVASETAKLAARRFTRRTSTVSHSPP
jgi:hypothetical protein